MRGQFFIISSVIIVSALVLITQYLYDFGKMDLSRLAELREPDYIRYVQTALNNSANTPCDMAGAELNASESLLKTSLAERGIQLTTSHSVGFGGNPSGVRIAFNLTSASFSSQTAFTTACIP